MSSSAKWVGRVVIVNAAIAAVVTMTFADRSGPMTIRNAFGQFAVAFLITSCISPACVIVLPKIAPAAFRRFAFPLNWAIVMGVMLVLAAAGSFVALLILAVIGYIKPDQILRAWFNNALRVSLIVTLILGIFLTTREILRSRLKTATMALRTKERDEAEARRLATEAQLASLESRVQPHFLFNTLNSIAALIPQDPVGAERMTGQLASLLRSSLDTAATPLVPLGQELKMATDYLEIERVRFGDRLRYEIDVEAGVETTPVPRLSLQTLVENSVKYAVSQNRTGATIRVRARPENGKVIVQVTDDGPGFELAAAVPGHGLALLRERLSMTYGQSAVLSVTQTEGLTVVRVEIPRDSVS